MGLRTVVYYLCTTFIAVVLGIILVSGVKEVWMEEKENEENEEKERIMRMKRGKRRRRMRRGERGGE